MPMSKSPIGHPSSNKSTRPNSHCFVCGPNNAVGLRLTFRLEDDFCRSTFTPDEHCQGYDGWLHGGIMGAVLDDVMANWFFLRGDKAITGRIEIRYRSPVPIGQELSLESWLLGRKGGVARLECKAASVSGEILAEASGTYRLVGKLAGEGSEQTEPSTRKEFK